MINIKNLGPNKIKKDEKSSKHILSYCISYEATNTVKPLYVIINKKMGTLEKVMEMNI